MIIMIVLVISVVIVIRHIFYKSGSKTFCFRCVREGIVIVNFIPQNNKRTFFFIKRNNNNNNNNNNDKIN